MLNILNRFAIEKKLREAKKKDKKSSSSGGGHKNSSGGGPSMKSASQRSMDRRKVVEDRKDNKKLSALQDLKAKREERKKQGDLFDNFFILLWFNIVQVTVPI